MSHLRYVTSFSMLSVQVLPHEASSGWVAEVDLCTRHWKRKQLLNARVK